MNSRKLLVFDISGEYGHFRKFNTTSSPLSYAIPTLPALAGLLGAVLGIERETSPGVFPPGVQPVNECFGRAQSWWAIRLLRPVRKVHLAFNLLDTEKSAASFFNIKNRTQIEFELLKNPKYRIYFWHEEERLRTAIARRLKAVEHHFTPYLGLSQLTATIEWQGTQEAKQVANTDAYIPIHSALNLSALQEEEQVQFGPASYASATMPMAMRRDRVVTEYAEVLIEKNTLPVQLRAKQYWQTASANLIGL